MRGPRLRTQFAEGDAAVNPNATTPQLHNAQLHNSTTPNSQRPIPNAQNSHEKLGVTALGVNWELWSCGVGSWELGGLWLAGQCTAGTVLSARGTIGRVAVNSVVRIAVGSRPRWSA